MVRTYTAVLLLAITAPVFAATEQRDGNWWQTLDEPTKFTYVAGFIDGMTLGYNFSYWGDVPMGRSPARPARMSQSSKSFIKMYTKYFTGVSSGQLCDGLTDFYKDARNRRILVHDATWLVLNQIAGMPKQTLNIMIESWRRNAQ